MIKKLGGLWSTFLFQSVDPRIWPLFRILIGVLLCIYSLHLFFEAELFFSSEGVFPEKFAKECPILLKDSPSVFYLGDDSVRFAQTCIGIFFLQSVLLTIGFWSRLQMASIFVWLVSLQHRSPIIFEGEDVVFRMFSFFAIFAPLSVRWSVDNQLFQKIWKRPFRIDMASAWPVRLIQFQMTAIYLSTALEKSTGSYWQDGTAMYYATRLHDLFGRFPVPSFPFENLMAIKALTWSVLVLEFALPFLLWIPKTRVLAVLLGFALHLGIEWSMNLFLFQWVMMVGLLMFLKPEEIPFVGKAILKEDLTGEDISGEYLGQKG